MNLSVIFSIYIFYHYTTKIQNKKDLTCSNPFFSFVPSRYVLVRAAFVFAVAAFLFSFFWSVFRLYNPGSILVISLPSPFRSSHLSHKAEGMDSGDSCAMNT